LTFFHRRARTLVHIERTRCCRKGTPGARTLRAVLCLLLTGSYVGAGHAAQPDPASEATAADPGLATPLDPVSAGSGGRDAGGEGGEAAPAQTGEPEPGVDAEAGDPDGAPPEVVAADPRWGERADSADALAEPTEPAAPSTLDFALGVQWFGLSGKIMPGIVLRFGEGLVWGAIEFSPIWLSQSSERFDGSFLGNQWGFHVELVPLRTRYVELMGGAGFEVYHLWGIHGDEALLGLALRLGALFRVTSELALTTTLRGYPIHSGGLGLGEARDGQRSVPLLGSLGAEWRFE